MATALKDHYGPELAGRLGNELQAVDPDFDREGLVAEVGPKLPELEFKQRIDLLAEAIHSRLPEAWPETAARIEAILGPENPDPEAGAFNYGFWLWPIARIVELHGLDHYDLSMELLREITKRHTSEFAIRPYLEADPAAALPFLRRWTRDPNSHVRRLVSEGTRPRLPWAARLHAFDDDPAPVLALLEALHADPSKYVRRSVANHIGDLLKADDPAAGWAMLERWARQDGNEWVIGHAIRNPLKHEDPRALALRATLEG